MSSLIDTDPLPVTERLDVIREALSTTAVSDDRSAAYASRFVWISRQRAHSGDRSSPVAA